MKALSLKPIGNWIIIKKIDIVDVASKKMKKSNIVLVGGSSPKNTLELEKQRSEAAMSYADAEKKFLEKWDEHPNQAVVVAVGDGVITEKGIVKTEVKVGDKVLFRGQTGEPLIVENELYWIIKEYDIFAITSRENI